MRKAFIALGDICVANFTNFWRKFYKLLKKICGAFISAKPKVSSISFISNQHDNSNEKYGKIRISFRQEKCVISSSKN